MITFSIPHCWCTRESAKAIGVFIHPHADKLSWVPRSQLSPDSEVRKPDDRGTLIVNAWWAKVSRTQAYYEEMVSGKANGPEENPGRRAEEKREFRNATSEYRRERT
jgi:hypothetical protein